VALSTIASEQSKGTQQTMQKCKQLLDYLATHPDDTVCFHASDMILNIHSDASYLSESKAHTTSVAIFSWDRNRTLQNQSNSTRRSSHSVQSYVLLWLLQPKQNSVPSFSTANRSQFFASHLKNLAIRNPQYQ
jgi:hypothetical protein